MIFISLLVLSLSHSIPIYLNLNHSYNQSKCHLTASWLVNIQDIIDKTTRMENQRNELQKQVDATNARIKAINDIYGNGVGSR